MLYALLVSIIPSWQRTPLHPDTHVQTPGDVHVPPFSHSGVQVDPTIGGVTVGITGARCILKRLQSREIFYVSALIYC